MLEARRRPPARVRRGHEVMTLAEWWEMVDAADPPIPAEQLAASCIDCCGPEVARSFVRALGEAVAEVARWN